MLSCNMAAGKDTVVCLFLLGTTKAKSVEAVLEFANGTAEGAGCYIEM